MVCEIASARFCITALRRDLRGDIVDPQGVDFAHYQRNPLVLFQHDPKLPVARSRPLEVFEDRVEAVALFDLRNPASAECFTLVAAGLLTGASIGLTAYLGGWDSQRRFNGTDGRVFLRWSLDEWSICPIPVNPGARLIKVSGQPKPSILRRILERPPWAPGIHWYKFVDLDNLRAWRHKHLQHSRYGV